MLFLVIVFGDTGQVQGNRRGRELVQTDIIGGRELVQTDIIEGRELVQTDIIAYARRVRLSWAVLALGLSRETSPVVLGNDLCQHCYE